MALITPDTYVKLVRLDVTPEHQLTFTSSTAQKNFFDNLQGLVLSDFTYQRKDNLIRYPALYETIEKYNYLVYCNEAQSNKYYYCYITNMKYINDEMTEIYIETDVFQTWQFDIIYKQTFIEREHVNNDTVGSHTVPEGIETGEYVVNKTEYYDGLDQLVYVLHADKYDIDSSSTSTAPDSTDMGGFPYIKGVMVFDTVSAFNQALNRYRTNNIDTSIWECYVVPRTFLDHEFTDPDPDFYMGAQTDPIYKTYSFTKPTQVDGYTPVNKKLLTYPYCYVNMSNNNGATRTLHYEKFLSQDCNFEIKGIPTIGGSIKCSPKYYTQNEQVAGLECEGIYAGKFPLLNWNNDTYKNWLETNSQTVNNQIISGTGTSVLGALAMALAPETGGLSLTLAGAGMTLAGAVSVGSAVSQVAEHKHLPDTLAGDTTGGEINISSSKNGFFFYKYSIKQEFAQIIDKYFSMFGYRINLVKLPNITGRTNWNFVKTRDCNIEGTEIPEKDINKLKSMFNTGITFWHNYSTFRDYSQSNSIVT